MVVATKKSNGTRKKKAANKKGGLVDVGIMVDKLKEELDAAQMEIDRLKLINKNNDGYILELEQMRVKEGEMAQNRLKQAEKELKEANENLNKCKEFGRIVGQMFETAGAAFEKLPENFLDL